MMEGFSPPGASITESEWLSASMPAGFRPAEIEASEKCSEQKEYGCRNTENSDNDCLDVPRSSLKNADNASLDLPKIFLIQLG